MTEIVDFFLSDVGQSIFLFFYLLHICSAALIVGFILLIIYLCLSHYEATLFSTYLYRSEILF